MTEQELKREHKVVYETRLGIMEVWGTPTSDEHNLAVVEANQHIIKLRAETGIVAQLRELRLNL